MPSVVWGILWQSFHNLLHLLDFSFFFSNHFSLPDEVVPCIVFSASFLEMDQLVAVEEAVEKLLVYLSTNTEKEASNANDVQSLFSPKKNKKCVNIEVEVAFRVSPQVHRVPLYFSVNHTFTLGSICLITAPPQRSIKNKIQALVENGDMTAARVKRVIDTKKLSEKVNTPVECRAFAGSYDNFVLYGVRKYPRQLCGEFFGHHKNPIWIPKKHKLSEALDIAMRTVVAVRRGQSTMTCRVGHTGLSVEENSTNIRSFIDQFVKHSQGSPMDHILFIRVAGTDSNDKRITLPIFAHTFRSIRTSSAENTPPAKKARRDV